MAQFERAGSERVKLKMRDPRIGRKACLSLRGRRKRKDEQGLPPQSLIIKHILFGTKQQYHSVPEPLVTLSLIPERLLLALHRR